MKNFSAEAISSRSNSSPYQRTHKKRHKLLRKASISYQRRTFQVSFVNKAIFQIEFWPQAWTTPVAQGLGQGGGAVEREF